MKKRVLLVDPPWYRLFGGFLPRIPIPALLVNAANDPFLGPGCFPRDEAAASRHFHLEVPDGGGHCGFARRGGEYWSEIRAAEFLAGGTLPPARSHAILGP